MVLMWWPSIGVLGSVVYAQISRLMSGLVLDGATLRRVEAVFERELRAGLADRPSSLQCENTYVPELPDGTGALLLLHLPTIPLRTQPK